MYEFQINTYLLSLLEYRLQFSQAAPVAILPDRLVCNSNFDDFTRLPLTLQVGAADKHVWAVTCADGNPCMGKQAPLEAHVWKNTCGTLLQP